MNLPTDEAAPEPTGATDSAGLPWAGRHLRTPAFGDDDGEPDPDLLAVLRRPGPRSAEDEASLLALLARCRLLVPLLVAPADEDEARGTSDPRDTSAPTSRELATVTLTGPDGQRALPAFTGLPALAAWDRAARPVPLSAPDVARDAHHRGCDVLVLDVGSPHSTVLRASLFTALASGRPWVPAFRDPVVVAAAAAAMAGEPAVVAHDLRPGASGSDAVVLTVRLRRGLSGDDVHRLTARVGQRLGEQAGMRARLDELVLRLAAAEEE